MADEAPTFDEDQARRARRALRDELGLGEETFALPAFVNMVGDEVASLREAGRSDEEIVGIIERATGERVDPAEMAELLARSERDRG